MKFFFFFNKSLTILRNVDSTPPTLDNKWFRSFGFTFHFIYYLCIYLFIYLSGAMVLSRDAFLRRDGTRGRF